MSHHISLALQERLVVYSMKGEVSISDFIECRSYAYEQGKKFAEYSQLIYFEAGARSTFTAAELRSLAERSADRAFGSIRVLLASQDLEFGMSRILASLRDGTGDPMNVVRTEDQAATLLQIPVPRLREILRGIGVEILNCGSQ